MLYLQNKGFRLIEAIVVMLIATIGLCFAAELFFSKPNLARCAGRIYPAGENPDQSRHALRRDRDHRRDRHAP